LGVALQATSDVVVLVIVKHAKNIEINFFIWYSFSYNK
jgi:hypothetical protein